MEAQKEVDIVKYWCVHDTRIVGDKRNQESTQECGRIEVANMLRGYKCEDEANDECESHMQCCAFSGHILKQRRRITYVEVLTVEPVTNYMWHGVCIMAHFLRDFNNNIAKSY